MATYKLIQDIEAEDHILGPLTLRQFIFAMITAFLLYICFISVVKHAIFLLVIFLPPALFFGFFALPFGRDQPTEIWFLAKLRFWFKPRSRVWNQDGVKELVTITVPKKIEKVLTKPFSQTEVKSRLSALAQTLDSRGWAVKHATVGGSTYAPPQITVGGSDDRLIGLDSLPQEVPTVDPVAANDIFDETANPLARQFDTMIDRASQAHRQQLMDELNSAPKAEPVAASKGNPAEPANWFMAQAQPFGPPAEPAASGGVASAPDDSTLSAQLAARSNTGHVSFGNLRTMQPLSAKTVQPATPDPLITSPSTPVTAASDPAILSLASSNDLNVATLAREASKATGVSAPGEVVISLH